MLGDWFLKPKWFAKKDTPLKRGSRVSRSKTYTAESGYVYEYRYEGQRPCSGEAGVEYVFQFSGGRAPWRRAGVVVADACLGARDTTSTERYAIAKLALQQAFDQAIPAQMQESVRVSAVQVTGILERLGLA